MPFSVNPEAEYHWRTRFRRQAAAPAGRLSAAPASHTSTTVDLRPAAPSASPGPKRVAARWRLPRLPLWLVVATGLLGGIVVLALVVDRSDEEARPAAGGSASSRSAVPAAGTPVEGADLETLLARFAASREASLVALRGYLLTDSEGFRTEWRDAAQALRLAAEAIERHSVSWTDGLRLVQFAEMKRLVDRLLAEQQAVAAMIGTIDRYPGLQLYNADVRPALDEAQAICTDVLDAMLADSSPEDAGMIDPFAKLRGDLEDLREALTRYAAGRGEAAMPPNAGPAVLAAMLATLDATRSQVPAALQPKIDRMIFLLHAARENLERVFALRTGQRWDYADYAFRTRILPLAEEMRAIGAGWEE